MLFTWLMLTGFIFLFAPQNLINKFQFTFARIFRLPLSISRNISLSANTQQPLADSVSRSEYNRLQNHLANITEQLEQEHQKFEKLSGLRNRLPLENTKLVIADIITATISSSNNEFIINRGLDDGLSSGQFVLGDNSIIGTIANVSSRTSQVKLITDVTSKIAVKLGNSDIYRLMEGNGNNSTKVRLLPINHKVKVGDNIYAGKKPGLLDAPMIAGTVVQCKRDDENPSLWDVTVKPVCAIEKLNDVAIIILNPKE